MNPINQPIPSPLPMAGLSASGPNQTGAQDGILFVSAARSLTGASGVSGAPAGSVSGVYTSDELYNPCAKGVRCYVLASGAATGTAQFKIQVIDPLTKTWINLPGATTTALDGTGSGVTGAFLTVYPGLTGIADVTGSPGDIKVNNILGPRWRGVLTVALSTSTCSVGADYLL